MSAQVLYAINFGNAVWLESKGRAPVDFLESNGIKAKLWDIRGKSGDDLAADIEVAAPDLVVNCAMFIHHGRLGNLANRFPDIKFVTTCHSSQSDLARNPCWIRNQFEFLDLAFERPNCFYALVDERTDIVEALDCPRLIHLSNCVIPSEYTPHVELHSPPVVSLICEWRPLKNIPNQLIAVAIANKRTTCKLLLSINNDRQGAALRFAEGLGLNLDARQWQPCNDYLKTVATEVDIALQASFTESFNFVSLDHMLAGKPVVGSPAIRFLPREWQPNPDDPRAIADTLVDVLEHYQAASELAKSAAAAQAEKSNAAFLDAMHSLLG